MGMLFYRYLSESQVRLWRRSTVWIRLLNRFLMKLLIRILAACWWREWLLLLPSQLFSGGMRRRVRIRTE